MKHEINIGNPAQYVGYALPPFDIKKAVYDASSIDGIIYIHHFLFDAVYLYLNQHIDKPFDIDPYGTMIGSIKIIATDLLPENEYCVITEIEFRKKF